jgi:hypothetical protein
LLKDPPALRASGDTDHNDLKMTILGLKMTILGFWREKLAVGNSNSSQPMCEYNLLTMPTTLLNQCSHKNG